MKNVDKLERKVYQIIGSIFGCIASGYFMIQLALNGTQGIIENIELFSSFSILFSITLAISSLILYVRKLFI